MFSLTLLLLTLMMKVLLLLNFEITLFGTFACLTYCLKRKGRLSKGSKILP